MENILYVALGVLIIHQCVAWIITLIIMFDSDSLKETYMLSNLVATAILVIATLFIGIVQALKLIIN